MLFATWMGGVLVLALRALHEFQRAARMRSGCVPVLDITVRNCYRQLYRQFTIPDPPTLLQFEGDGSPLLLGLRNPAILIPASLIESGTEDEIRMLLAHELAHYRRGDLLWCWIPAMAHLLFYFHPLVWLANREWPLDQEMACDLEAVEATNAAIGDYGEMLVKIAIQRPSVPHPGLASIRGDESLETLKRRLDAMNDLSIQPSPALRTAGVALAALACIALAPWRVVAQAARVAPVTPQTGVNQNLPKNQQNIAKGQVSPQPVSLPAVNNDKLIGDATVFSPSRSPELAGYLADLGSTDQFKRSAAVNALAESFPESYPGQRNRVVLALSAMLNDENLFIRQAAVRALAVWGGRSALPYILTALNDKEHSVRWATLDILAKLRDPRSADAVAARLSYGDGFKASPALVAIGPAAERSVLGCMNDMEWSVRMEACKILKQIGTKASLPMLQQAAADQNGLVVMAANDAIAEINKR